MNNLLCRRFFLAAACVLLAIGGVAAQTSLPLSFGDALRQMQNGNRSLKIADKGIEAARAERDKLNALWYPSLQGAGTFVHLSEKIEVKQPLSQFTDPAKDFVHNIVPDDQLIHQQHTRPDRLPYPCLSTGSTQPDFRRPDRRMGRILRRQAHPGLEDRQHHDRHCPRKPGTDRCHATHPAGRKLLRAETCARGSTRAAGDLQQPTTPLPECP